MGYQKKLIIHGRGGNAGWRNCRSLVWFLLSDRKSQKTSQEAFQINLHAVTFKTGKAFGCRMRLKLEWKPASPPVYGETAVSLTTENWVSGVPEKVNHSWQRGHTRRLTQLSFSRMVLTFWQKKPENIPGGISVDTQINLHAVTFKTGKAFGCRMRLKLERSPACTGLRWREALRAVSACGWEGKAVQHITYWPEEWIVKHTHTHTHTWCMCVCVWSWSGMRCVMCEYTRLCSFVVVFYIFFTDFFSFLF